MGDAIVIRRRAFIGRAALPLATAGLAIAGLAPGCTGGDELVRAAQALRQPLTPPADEAGLWRELVRCATLAANSHNTQPWRFAVSGRTIWIRPDLTRRTPVVDPDDHHLWVSLGCAGENLVLAAAALGWQADVGVEAAGLRIALERRPAQRSVLADAIFQRQCTRGDYDGRPLRSEDLDTLARAATQHGVRALLLTGRSQIENVLGHATQANRVQMRDAAFVAELKRWLRFSSAEALARGDGLFTGCTGNPALPRWLGSPLFDLFFREGPENDKLARQLRSSAGVVVFAAEQADPPHWVAVGRAYERFALAAVPLGVRNAFVNPPVEVPSARTPFAQGLGLGARRPDLVVRFGHGPAMPYSLRRPVAQVLA